MTKEPHYTVSGPDFEANPYPTYATMQHDDPIYRHEWPDGGITWLVTRYEDAELILKDHKRFVKNYRNCLTPAEQAELSPESDLHQLIDNHMLNLDPPDHTRLRALVNKAFTPRMINQLESRVRTIADDLIDRVRDQGEMDLIDDYAFPLPIIVIADLLGLPAQDRERLRAWSNAFIGPIHNENEYQHFAELMLEFTSYLAKLFAERRQQPRDDLITALVQAEEAGDKLTEAELSSMVVLLIVAGHETTVHLIGTGMLALLQHPQQLDQLRNDPSLMEAAVEELLRYDGPVEKSTVRWAAEDVEIGGRLIRRKEAVNVVLCAANRDPELFNDPEKLDFCRENSRHLGFGLGIHYCAGAPLARMEGRIALNTLLRRLPELRLKVPVESLQWRRTPPVRGLKHLPVGWS